jgi:acetyltransferase-like isoleucine patch superfamily enzyme
MPTRLAVIFTEPYKHRYPLATLYPHGFTAPDAALCNSGIVRGKFVYIGSCVNIFRNKTAGELKIGDRVHINDGNCIELGAGGSMELGDETYIQPRCQFSAYVGHISIGKRVQIAPGCAFYAYNHGILRDQSIKHQPLSTKGGIVIKDEAWLGYGAVVLDGVTIGQGAVVGAGAIVTSDIPDFGIAAGNPAKIIRMR